MIALCYNSRRMDLGDCGTGSGGFKKGNTCAGGGEERQPQYIKDQIKRQQELVSNLEKKLKEPSPIEKLYAVSGNGTVILSKQGDRTMVVIDPDDAKKMQEDGNTIVTHNHPQETSLSYPDIVFASKVNLKEVRAVAGAKTYIAKRPKEGWPDADKIIDRHDTINKRLFTMLKPRLDKEVKSLNENWEKLPIEKRNYSTLKNIYTKYTKFHSEALSSYVLKRLGVPYSIEVK